MNLPRIFVASVLAEALLLTGCGSGSSNSAPPSDAGGTDSGKSAPPSELLSFESNGEGMCEAPVTPDWKTASDILTQANGTWAKLKVKLAADGADAKTIASIDKLLTTYGTDVSMKLVREAETDANTINGLVPDFFELYDQPVPSDTFRLDAAFRFLEIQGEHSDYTTGATALAKTKAVWGKLKPLVASKAATRADIPDAATVVADVDAALAQAETALSAKNDADIKTAAHRGLDLVDVVEQTFK